MFQRLCLLASSSRWLEREGLGAWELTGERAELFLAERQAAGYVTWVSPRSVALPLAFLREVGAVPSVAAVAAEGPVEELLVGYREYLALERGLAGSTIVEYERTARVFFEQRPVGLELERLTAADVSGFLSLECSRRSVPGSRKLVSGLRPLLRYLHVAGLIGSPLVWAVPGVADQRDRSLPRGLDAAVVARLLASCDRRRTVGRRDYAILLLLVRLGLRAGEVAAMQLEDLDWRRGEVLVRGKRDRHDRLPLPVDVGEAHFGAAFTEEQQRNGAEYNFRHVNQVPPQRQGMSAFALNDGVVHHTFQLRPWSRAADGDLPHTRPGAARS